MRAQSCSLEGDGQEEMPGEEKGQVMGGKAPVSRNCEQPNPTVQPLLPLPIPRGSPCKASLAGAGSRLGCFLPLLFVEELIRRLQPTRL